MRVFVAGATGAIGTRRARRRALIAGSASRSAGVGRPPRTSLVAAALPVLDHVPKDTGITDSTTIENSKHELTRI